MAVRFLPNDVYLLEPVLEAVGRQGLQWQTKYILLLWLSLIVLAPFDLERIQSSTEEGLVQRLLDLAKGELASPGKERDACAILCARVLSRRDVWRAELPQFMNWAVEEFENEGNLLLVLSEATGELMRNWGCWRVLHRFLPTQKGRWGVRLSLLQWRFFG
jgi:hypothetical protein